MSAIRGGDCDQSKKEGARVRHGSEILEHLIQSEGLVVVGAEYSLESGLVDFFDGVPAPD